MRFVVLEGGFRVVDRRARVAQTNAGQRRPTKASAMPGSSRRVALKSSSAVHARSLLNSTNRDGTAGGRRRDEAQRVGVIRHRAEMILGASRARPLNS